MIVVCNLTPNTLENYKIGVHKRRKLQEIFNSDAKEYGGSGVRNSAKIVTKKEPWNGKEYQAEVVLSPLGITVFSIV